MCSASSTVFPRIRSITSLIFRGEEPMYRLIARASMCPCSRKSRFELARGLFLPHPGMPPENPRRRELPELVPDHPLVDVHRDELVAVVNRERVPDKVRRDRRRARPGLDDLLLVRPVELRDFLHQRDADERPFLQRTCHTLLSAFD